MAAAPPPSRRTAAEPPPPLPLLKPLLLLIPLLLLLQPELAVAVAGRSLAQAQRGIDPDPEGYTCVDQFDALGVPLDVPFPTTMQALGCAR
eukprot:356034-Chlamydomonas_euryale.AAC.8